MSELQQHHGTRHTLSCSVNPAVPRTQTHAHTEYTVIHTHTHTHTHTTRTPGAGALSVTPGHSHTNVALHSYTKTRRSRSCTSQRSGPCRRQIGWQKSAESSGEDGDGIAACPVLVAVGVRLAKVEESEAKRLGVSWRVAHRNVAIEAPDLDGA